MLLQCQSGGDVVRLKVQLIETSSPTSTDYALTEQIDYDVVVTNTGTTTVYNVDIAAARSGDSWHYADISAASSQTLTTGATVTEADIIAGYITETVSVTYEDGDGNQYSTSAVLTIQNIEAPRAELTVTLSTNKNSYEVGEVVHGDFVVQNTGNLTINNIGVAAFSDNYTLVALAPGGSRPFNDSQYLVSMSDVGTRTFTSTTTGTPPSGTTLTVNEGSVSVTVQYVFSYKVNTAATTSGAKDAAIPFNLSGISSSNTMTVDWGDGTTSALKASNYGSNYSDGTASIHTYTTAGEYTIRITYDGDWNATSLGWFATSTSTLTPSNSNARTKFIAVFNSTLTEILTPLPHFGIVRYYSSATTTSGASASSNTLNHVFRYCKKLRSVPANVFCEFGGATSALYTFYSCSSLASIPAKLLEPLVDITSLESCFYGCSSLTSIPAGLFDKNTKVTSLSGLFYNCNNSQLTTLPAGLFDKLTEVTSLYQVFYGMSYLSSVPSGIFDKLTKLTNAAYIFNSCTRLASVNTGLFRYNTAITTFQYCFRSCSALTTLPSDLFQYNTAVTNMKNVFQSASNLGNFDIHIGSTKVSSGNAANFVTKKTGATRTVRVPSGSTTQTTFNSVASSLGLTVVGE